MAGSILRLKIRIRSEKLSEDVGRDVGGWLLLGDEVKIASSNEVWNGAVVSSMDSPE